MPNYIEISLVVSDKRIFFFFFFRCYGMDTLKNFKSVLPKDHFCEIWLKLALWFRNLCSLKKIVDGNIDRQTRMMTTDGE